VVDLDTYCVLRLVILVQGRVKKGSIISVVFLKLGFYIVHFIVILDLYNNYSTVDLS